MFDDRPPVELRPIAHPASLPRYVLVSWPIAIENTSPAVAGTVLWRHVGRQNLTVVVKATFSLEDGVARAVIAEDIVTSERFNAQSGSLSHDVDIAPHKPRAEVTFVGSAWPAAPAGKTEVRLLVEGVNAMLDKTLQVVGDRAANNQEPAPFRSMPLVWERAWGDGISNPVGVTPNRGRTANVFAPNDPTAPAGFGPLARGWGARLRFVGRGDPRLLEGTRPEMPNDISWGFFLAAPSDQQVGKLRGDELITLQNLLEGRPLVRSKLPGARATARLVGPTAPNGNPIELKLDTLVIEGGSQIVSLVWRGTTPFPDADAASRSKVVVDLELGDSAHVQAERAPATQRIPSTALEPPTNPQQFKPEPKTMQVGARFAGLPKLHDDGAAVFDLDEPESTSGSTMAIDPDAAMRMIANARGALPFGMNPPGRAPGPPPAPPPPAPPPPAPPAQAHSRQPPPAPPPPPPAQAHSRQPPPAPPPPAPPPPMPPLAPQGVVVRATASYAIEDEDSVGSTMAITPEAAAELLARAAPTGAGHGRERLQPRNEPQPPLFEAPPAPLPAGQPAKPSAKTNPPNLPPPAPPPPIPTTPQVGQQAAAEPRRHGTLEMDVVPDSDEQGGGTMVLQVPEGAVPPGARKQR